MMKKNSSGTPLQAIEELNNEISMGGSHTSRRKVSADMSKFDLDDSILERSQPSNQQMEMDSDAGKPKSESNNNKDGTIF